MSRITLEHIRKGTWNIGDVFWANEPGEMETIGIVMKASGPMLLTKQNPLKVTALTVAGLAEVLEVIEQEYDKELKLWQKMVAEHRTLSSFAEYMVNIRS